MTEEEKKQIEKYFNGSVSPEEAEWVLNWFSTKEGERFLDRKLTYDIDKIKPENPHAGAAYQTFKSIASQLDAESSNVRYQPHQQKRSYTGVAVLSLLLIISAVAYFNFIFSERGDRNSESIATVLYTTGEGENRLISLSDGTQIRLNENSQIELPEKFSNNMRALKLRGEAFFDVARDEVRPFIITSDDIRVHVLGTKFLLKAPGSSSQTLVAVSDGLISFGRTDRPESEALIIRENMVGYFNPMNGEITSEATAVQNYLSWMNGRIEFNGELFTQVAKQLSHIYDIEYELESDGLQELRLTADISAGSMKEVFDTIAETLEIEYTITHRKVYWKF